MDKKTSLVDAFIADLAVRYWWIAVLAVLTFLGGLALSRLLHKKEFREIHKQLREIKGRLKHPYVSQDSAPYMVIYGIAESDGQNRQEIGTVDAAESTLKVTIGPTTAGKPTCYIELPPGRVVRTIEDLVVSSDETANWTRLPGTYVWYYSGPPFRPGIRMGVNIVTELVS